MLNRVLGEVVASLYPSISISDETKFQPMLDLSRGDISSTAAIEIARVTRERAEAIAERIIGEVRAHVPGDWRSGLGYIVLAGADADVLVREVLQVSQIFQPLTPHLPARQVVCLTPDTTVPLYARLRLLSLSTLQALLTVTYEGACRFAISLRPSILVRSQAEVMSELRSATEAILAEQHPQRADLKLLFDSCPPGRTTVFTSHHYHDSLSASDKRYLGGLKAQGVLHLRMPGDGWLLSRERALTELLSADSMRQVLQQLSGEDAWLRWVFHNGSAEASGDLDPMVALFDECASPLWSVRVLIERFERLTGSLGRFTGRQGADAVTRIDAAHRALLVRSLFLPMWLGRAVREGEVLGFMTVLEELAGAGHAFLNRPDTRLSLLKGPGSDPQHQIVAGLSFGLSSILPVVFGGSACGDQMHKA